MNAPLATLGGKSVAVIMVGLCFEFLAHFSAIIVFHTIKSVVCFRGVKDILGSRRALTNSCMSCFDDDVDKECSEGWREFATEGDRF